MEWWGRRIGGGVLGRDRDKAVCGRIQGARGRVGVVRYYTKVGEGSGREKDWF